MNSDQIAARLPALGYSPNDPGHLAQFGQRGAVNGFDRARTVAQRGLRSVPGDPMRFVLFAVLLLLTPATARAQSLDDSPPVYVAQVYDRLSKDQDYNDPDALYTPRLAALWADMQKDAGGEVGRIDFFPWTNSQDWSLSDLSMTSEVVDGREDRMIVTVRFKNGGEPQVIRSFWEKSGKRWRLDDMQSLGKDAWTLSLILKYGWSSQD